MLVASPTNMMGISHRSMREPNPELTKFCKHAGDKETLNEVFTVPSFIQRRWTLACIAVLPVESLYIAVALDITLAGTEPTRSLRSLSHKRKTLGATLTTAACSGSPANL